MKFIKRIIAHFAMPKPVPLGRWKQVSDETLKKRDVVREKKLKNEWSNNKIFFPTAPYHGE